MSFYKDYKLFWRIARCCDIESPGRLGCWEWPNVLNNMGYGRTTVTINGKYISKFVHRIMSEIVNGPTKLCVCHRCDNPKCCNPDHLFIGTVKDNVQDMIAKGRKSTVAARGEQAGLAKLTTEQVIEARIMQMGGISGRAISRYYGVSKNAISSILSGRTWNHVTGLPKLRKSL